MLTHTWVAATLSDVLDNGPNYMYSLLCDYERYIKNFGFIPVELFLSDWTCITYKNFELLGPGDIVYTPQGVPYVIVDSPYESDDEVSLYIEAVKMNDDGSYDDTGRYNELLQTGDIYEDNITHKDYARKRKKESEEPLCPILITKTNQPQS
jgi:hypothetical protein